MARSDMTVELTLTNAAKMLIAEAKEQLELNDKERAVIEAARAWVSRWASEMDDIVEYVPEARRFKEAVEVLDSEGE